VHPQTNTKSLSIIPPTFVIRSKSGDVQEQSVLFSAFVIHPAPAHVTTVARALRENASVPPDGPESHANPPGAITESSVEMVNVVRWVQRPFAHVIEVGAGNCVRFHVPRTISGRTVNINVIVTESHVTHEQDFVINQFLFLLPILPVPITYNRIGPGGRR
jgi:hypothetical protein